MLGDPARKARRSKLPFSHLKTRETITSHQGFHFAIASEPTKPGRWAGRRQSASARALRSWRKPPSPRKSSGLKCPKCTGPHHSAVPHVPLQMDVCSVLCLCAKLLDWDSFPGKMLSPVTASTEAIPGYLLDTSQVFCARSTSPQQESTVWAAFQQSSLWAMMGSLCSNCRCCITSARHPQRPSLRRSGTIATINMHICTFTRTHARANTCTYECAHANSKS